ncbi:MAG: signal peptide peptidase SppA [Desulfobacterales bacterium]|nr:signal peptide peptidase SppA [Desulfobacterales bacterium]
MLLLTIISFITLIGCFPKVHLFPDEREPLQEFTIEGHEKGKVLVIPIIGFLSDSSKEGLIREKPSIVQEIVSQLRRAEKDKEIKAVLLKINSPGGTSVASDLIYHELLSFKRRTGVKIVVEMMDVAASGGYYIALTADLICAHPLTITGSVGVIFIRPDISGLLNKIGVNVTITKSGLNKDMGNFLCPATEKEIAMFQNFVDEYGKNFINLVIKHRKIEERALADITTARIYSAKDALKFKLIDKIGYIDDALVNAKELAGLSKEAKVVVYRRSRYSEDTIYNDVSSSSNIIKLTLVDFGLSESMQALHPGFYYLWVPADSTKR